VRRSTAVDPPSSKYFSGKLLDVASFALEQSYFRGPDDPRAATGVWLELDAGSGFEPWYEVEDFSCSQRRDRHFILDRQAAVVRFGDGERGQVPPPGAAVRGWYRLDAGVPGNVALSGPELVMRLAEVSHFSWMRQKARDEREVVYEELDSGPTDHDRERAEDALAELKRVEFRRSDL